MRVRKRRVFAFVAIVTLLTVVAWLWNDGRGGGAGQRVAATTLARGAHGGAIAWSAEQRASLRTALEGAFATSLDGAQSWSLAIVDGDGSTIFSERADDAVAPASVQKLLVAATALQAFGSDFRFQTLFAARDLPQDGVLDGDLWLAGSGDPSLQSADLRNGVAVLARAGLRRVDGGLIADATSLRGPALNPHWSEDDEGQDYAAPTSALSVDGDTIESHQLVDGVDEAVWTPMTDVSRYVAAQTAAMLTARGIVASSPPATGAAPLDAVVLWDHRSAPLRAIEAHMLFVSDNHYAEQLLRAVGAKVLDQPDDAGGLLAERQFLERNAIPATGLQLFDGSGLSSHNRVAAITVARLLAAKQSVLYPLLPRGGREGTLADYDFTTALGRVRAKSGHLSNVSSLAGYAATYHHGRVAFAFLIDGSPADPDAAIVRAVDRLVQY